MRRAACMASAPTWEAAIEEAVRLNWVCHQKFGPPSPEHPHVWTYRIRRRPWGSRAMRWQVFTPWGTIPSTRRP